MQQQFKLSVSKNMTVWEGFESDYSVETMRLNGDIACCS